MVTHTKPQLICLTPTRNEKWIIDPFLSAASFWADHIIVADQQSSDGTIEAVGRNPRARLVLNESPRYDEAARQRLLLQHARDIPGRKIFIALDADEALSSNLALSAEWSRLKDALPGTVLRFPWVNILPGFERAWVPPNLIACGFVDDGEEHVGRTIHSQRLPYRSTGPFLDFHDIVVLHFQFIAWDRMASKHRWYQAWEHLNQPESKPLQIFRRYHHMNGSWSKSELYPVKPEWTAEYIRRGIDFQSLRGEEITWWDREIVEMLTSHGAEHFKKIALWDKNWSEIAEQLGLCGERLADPRSHTEKLCHWLLARTQRNRAALTTRILERVLRTAGW